MAYSTRLPFGAMTLGASLFGLSAQAQIADEPVVLDPIILQGERISRPLEETYVGASVLEPDARAGASPQAHINDLVNTTPNVFVESKSEVPSVRGVQGGGPGGLVSASLTGALPRLSFVIDGVTRPAALPNSSGSSIWDLRQIEVLRGPQSLLRGRSVYAGAIILETNDPSFTPEAALQFGIEGDDFHGPNAMLNGMISGPLSDRVAGRLTFELENGSDPRRATDVADDWIVDYDTLRVRGKLLGEFDTALGPLELNLLAETQSGQTPQTRNTVQTSEVTGRPLEDRVLVNVASGPFGIPARTFNTQTNVLSLDAAWQLGAGTFRSVTSYVDDSYVSIPEQVYPFPFDVEDRIFTQEFLWEFGPDERVFAGEFGGVTGFSYEDREQRTDIGGLFTFESEADMRSTAVFADLRYGLTDALTLFGGARLLRYEDDRDQLSSAPTAGGLVTGHQDFDEDETTILPTLGLAYHFDETRVLSGSLRRGFNPGGTSVNIFSGQPYIYDSETVTTAEVTYRQSAPDGRYGFSIGAFYNRFEDPQLYAELVPGNRASLQVINQPEGRSYGVELEGRIAVTDRLRLDGALGLLETEITKAQASNSALKGNDFGQDPAITLSLGAAFDLTPGWTLDGRATYRGTSFNDFNEVAADEVGDFWIADIGVTGRIGDAELRGSISNLFDETGITRFVGGGTFADVTEPRTIGLTLTQRW